MARKEGEKTTGLPLEASVATTEKRLNLNLEALRVHIRDNYFSKGRKMSDLSDDAVAQGYINGVMKDPNEAIRLIQEGLDTGKITQQEATAIREVIVPLAIKARMQKAKLLKPNENK